MNKISDRIFSLYFLFFHHGVGLAVAQRALPLFLSSHILLVVNEENFSYKDSYIDLYFSVNYFIQFFNCFVQLH